eukprot:scaffold735_cov376-Prasinococcus_capsulatus_cf.AAC.23
MRENGCGPLEIAIAGGATRSPLWLQIHADVCGLPFRVTHEKEAPSLGCAMLAAVAVGMYPTLQEAAEHMVHVKTRIEPRPDVYLEYRAIYQKYLKLYPALKPLKNLQGEHSIASDTNEDIIVAPSLLSAGRGDQLIQDAKSAGHAGAKWLHVDIMNEVPYRSLP